MLEGKRIYIAAFRMRQIRGERRIWQKIKPTISEKKKS